MLADHELGSLVVKLVLGAFIALGIRATYRWRRRTLPTSMQDELAPNFVPLTLATIVLVTVVQSSVAVGLGLLGALSIVRARTAVKEIEDLLFVFLTVAVGLALGAGQLVLGSVATTVVLVLSWASLHHPARTYERHWLLTGRGDGYESLLESLELAVPGLRVHRVEQQRGSSTVQALATLEVGEEGAVLPRLRSLSPSAEWSMTETGDVL